MTDNVHALVIPTSGLLELLHSEHVIDAEHQLALRTDTEVAKVKITASPIEGGHYDIWTVVGDGTLPVNPRAQKAVAHLSGVNMEFHGPVVLHRLNAAQTFVLMRVLDEVWQ
jgi:hypothetical protein